MLTCTCAAIVNAQPGMVCLQGIIAEKVDEAKDLLSSSSPLDSKGNGEAAAKTSEGSTMDDSEKRTDHDNRSEVEVLKSTLAMVAALARQAQDATLQERMESADRIKTLEAKLSAYVDK